MSEAHRGDEQELIEALEGLRAHLHEEKASGAIDFEERDIDAEIDEGIAALQAYFRGEIELPMHTIALTERAVTEVVPDDIDWERVRAELAETIEDAKVENATLIHCRPRHSEQDFL